MSLSLQCLSLTLLNSLLCLKRYKLMMFVQFALLKPTELRAPLHIKLKSDLWAVAVPLPGAGTHLKYLDDAI